MEFFDQLPEARAVRSKPIDWTAVKAELILNEGKWALIAEDIANSTPAQLRSGQYKDFPLDEIEHFEFAVRKPTDPEKPYGKYKSDLYGRYVG